MCISGRSLTLASNITSELELCRYISYDLHVASKCLKPFWYVIYHLCLYFSWGMDLSCIWAMLLCSTLRGTSSQLTALLTTPWGPLVTCGNTTGKNWTCDSEHLLDMFIIFYQRNASLYKWFKRTVERKWGTAFLVTLYWVSRQGSLRCT